MAPKRISSKLTGVKLVLLLLGLILLAPALIGSWSAVYFGNIAMQMVVGLSITVISIYLLQNPVHVTFDENYMYISRRKQVQQIPLENIYKIKLTLTSISRARFFWKIGYKNNSGVQRSIRVLPSEWNNHFEEFKQKVKQRNPSVMIKNWSHSFDFDQ